MNPLPRTVYLVGAGPGDPELITVRGLRLLRGADVVVHDRLIDPELLREARPDAEIIHARRALNRQSDPQRRINTWIIDRARRGKSVVRLKGGDPIVFGRGGEEMLACRDAGIDCVVVPGVTSATAAPASAGIPVTHRGLCRSFAVITARASGKHDNGPPDFRAWAHVDTLIIMMGRANLAHVARALIAAGRDPATPAACIEQATTPRQRVTRATLDTIAAAADRHGLRTPAVTVIGRTVSLACDAGVIRLARGRATA